MISSLSLLMPVLVSRLGMDDITEPSEELRLSLVCLLSCIVQACCEDIVPYVHDVILILQHTIVDPYPHLKRVSLCIATCTCSLLLCTCI